jgi:SAM-dependent methyltransferase
MEHHVSTTARPLATSPRLAPHALEQVRRSRRYPRPTQFDYLHLRLLRDDLSAAIACVPGSVRDVLDVFCGSRPYEDLFPSDARCVGLDVIGNPYGVADVVTNEFLPFPEESFDVVVCIEAFHYVEDPAHGVRELRRVLRPGGTVIVSVPFVWPYDRTILERRFTGPELVALFQGWQDVSLTENGGRAVAWAALTGSLLESAKIRLPRMLRAPFPLLYLAVNGVAAILDTIERRSADSSTTLPMNLLLTARRPQDA